MKKMYHMDRVDIKSNAMCLEQIGKIAGSIHRFLVAFKRSHRSYFDTINKQIIDRYFFKSALKRFLMVTPPKIINTLFDIREDLYALLKQFKPYAEVSNSHCYKMLKLVFYQEFGMVPIDTRKLVKVKKLNSTYLASTAFQYSHLDSLGN